MISSKRPNACRKSCSISPASRFSAVRFSTKARPASRICAAALPNDSIFQDYDTLRFDTFHQFLYPNTYFGWLSVVPRVGFRATYYNETRDSRNVIFEPSTNPLIPDFLIPPPTAVTPLVPGGDRLRTIVNAGVEASFKVSRTWEQAQSRALGLDGLRHIIQPFMNFSYVTGDNTNPAEILQFDRYQPSTQLAPDRFPAVHLIDSIDNWTIARLGRAQPPSDPARRLHDQLAGTGDLLRRQLRQSLRQERITPTFTTICVSRPCRGRLLPSPRRCRSSRNGFTEVNTSVSVPADREPDSWLSVIAT